VAPTTTGTCGRCGFANFDYSAVSRDRVRGYRCAGCGGIKPESNTEYRVMVQTPDRAQPFEPGITRDPFTAIAIMKHARELAAKKGWSLSYHLERV
jgi:hypothetical protein